MIPLAIQNPLNALQLLVFEFAFQLLGLGYLAHCFVEIVLVDRVSVVLDGEQTTGELR
jgi:hypothetical protein